MLSIPSVAQVFIFSFIDPSAAPWTSYPKTPIIISGNPYLPGWKWVVGRAEHKAPLFAFSTAVEYLLKNFNWEPNNGIIFAVSHTHHMLYAGNNPSEVDSSPEHIESSFANVLLPEYILSNGYQVDDARDEAGFVVPGLMIEEFYFPPSVLIGNSQTGYQQYKIRTQRDWRIPLEAGVGKPGPFAHLASAYDALFKNNPYGDHIACFPNSSVYQNMMTDWGMPYDDPRFQEVVRGSVVTETSLCSKMSAQVCGADRFEMFPWGTENSNGQIRTLWFYVLTRLHPAHSDAEADAFIFEKLAPLIAAKKITVEKIHRRGRNDGSGKGYLWTYIADLMHSIVPDYKIVEWSFLGSACLGNLIERVTFSHNNSNILGRYQKGGVPSVHHRRTYF